jgi:hypothetical protein
MTYYRVYDAQRGCYFGTAYNATSMEELVTDFHGYVRADGDGEDISSLKTWEDIAALLGEVSLEESNMPFEELDFF